MGNCYFCWTLFYTDLLRYRWYIRFSYEYRKNVGEISTHLHFICFRMNHIELALETKIISNTKHPFLFVFITKWFIMQSTRGIIKNEFWVIFGWITRKIESLKKKKQQMMSSPHAKWQISARKKRNALQPFQTVSTAFVVMTHFIYSIELSQNACLINFLLILLSLHLNRRA